MMKIINHVNVCPTFGVDFHGVRLTLPMKYLYGYLAMDSDNIIHAYEYKPSLEKSFWLSHPYDSNTIVIASVKTDMYWRKTLVSLADHSVTKYLK